MTKRQEQPALSDLLERLFENIRPEGLHGRRYTNEEVAVAIKKEAPVVRVSGAYLSALRRGSKKNPSTELLRALAHFFGVPASYFLDEGTARHVDAEIALARVAQNHDVRNLALRALELSPETLAAVTQIVDAALRGDGASPSSGRREERGERGERSGS
ncbi:helix-turn-helix domain-containing protein [Streptomyces sp. 6N223]|uniref:helix-turn-helix domain-containing protein n=1 Tax=Streptomyces sp. 6N223 TaxID=3457412 RepID=UPI003FD41A5A